MRQIFTSTRDYETTHYCTGRPVGTLAKNLSRSMMNSDNPEVVAAGAPAYLLLLDALVLTYPDDEDFLLSASKLYGAYSGVFSRDPIQTKRMADKALEYATRGLCEYDDDACAAVKLPQDEMLDALNHQFDEDDIHVFYAYAAAKATAATGARLPNWAKPRR